MKSWYTIKAQATATAPAEVSIYGDIGAWGVTASQFIADVRPISGPLRVRINSEGGDVFDGLAIYHYLAGRGNVETIIDGRAASAASLPFLAGVKRVMPKTAYLMVHNPWSGAVGSAGEMRKVADLLDQIGGSLADVYASVTGMAKDAVQALMDAETWLDGTAALAGKWATEVLDVGPVRASVRRGRYAKTPALILGAEWTAPEAARNAFRKGIQQVEDGLGGDGLEAATVKEARALASGERPTDFKVRKANAWWGRNERFLDAEANTPADVSANLWGGAAGRDWFRALFNELDAEKASVRAAAPGELVVGDFVELSYGDGTTKGEVVEVLTSGTAAGADGMLDATAEDPAAIVGVLRETAVPGEFEEADIQVARLFSTLTKTETPRIVEVESPDAQAKISASTNAVPKTPMKTTAKLLALLGVQPAAEDTFLSSAIADLGVTAEAVQKARESGTSDFLAQHITARIGEADARAKAATSLVEASCKALGIDVPATPEDAAKAIQAAVAKAASEELAKRGLQASRVNAPAANAKPAAELSGLERAQHLFAAQQAAKN